MKTKARSVHVFVWGPHSTAGVKSEPICNRCGEPRSRAVHNLNLTDDEARLIDARRLGEV